MKYLKYLLGIILLLVLLFIGKGFLTPSISYDSAITVDKPLKEAWAVMNDESKITEWLKGITKIEHVSGEKGTVGAVTKYTFEENGQKSEILETITSISPEESITMTFVMEGVMEMDYKVEFVETAGKTQLKSSTINRGVGVFMRSMMSFMKGSMQKQEDENMGNLKKLIDGNTTDYFSVPVGE